MENAKKWFVDERIEWIRQRYSKPDVKLFENPMHVDKKKFSEC